MNGDPLARSDGRTKPDRTWYPENFDWYLKWVASILILISICNFIKIKFDFFQINFMCFNF